VLGVFGNVGNVGMLGMLGWVVVGVGCLKCSRREERREEKRRRRRKKPCSERVSCFINKRESLNNTTKLGLQVWVKISKSNSCAYFYNY
jgi:hypothetical protein